MKEPPNKSANQTCAALALVCDFLSVILVAVSFCVLSRAIVSRVIQIAAIVTCIISCT